MDRGYGVALFFAALIVSIAMRAPHAKRSKTVAVAVSHMGKLEILLLGLAGIGQLILPVLYAAGRLSFADDVLTPWAFAAGIVVSVVGLWLFHRSHADLGTNWSMTLQVREDHRLVTSGVYARIRHPMYAAIFCIALAQLLLLANWIAGPAMLVAFTLVFAARVHPEEQMMRERFGAEYETYARRTKRLIPGVW
ncbi:MAG TPA: protein-S-isoprenylcysteine O-methyltransferase [Planctomycetota bacterium]|nr:protein-S-isoprenylcysteine O-methyltransferase [Planctomycetota bacterium]